MNDRLRDRCAEFGHALGEPRRHTTTMKWKIRDARAFHGHKKAQKAQKRQSNICALCAFLWLTVFLTHAADVEACSKDHREQEEDRDQHDECVP